MASAVCDLDKGAVDEHNPLKEEEGGRAQDQGDEADESRCLQAREFISF